MEPKAMGAGSQFSGCKKHITLEEQRQSECGPSQPYSLVPRGPTLARRDDRMQMRNTGRDTHLSKSTLSDDPMEIKVVQVDFAFEIYRSGETTAHSSSTTLGGDVRVGWRRVKEREGIRSVKSV